MLSDEDAHRPSLSSDLRSIGRIPRALAAVAVIISGALSWAGFQASGSLTISLILVPPSVVVFVLSFRLRAWVTNADFFLRSYVRTYRVPFADVLFFAHLPYSGFWNRSGGMELKSKYSLRMIDVTRNDRSGQFLPATMCTRYRCERIVIALNDLVDDAKPIRSPRG